MTTPQTPAGWYADPDGSGGQRYWDGHTWTEHRAPAPQPPPPPPAPPNAPRAGAHRTAEDEPPEATTAFRIPPPPLPGPTPGPPPRVGGDDSRLLMRYLTACAALLVVLVAVAVYAAFFADKGASTIEAFDDPTTSLIPTLPPTPTTTASGGWGDGPTGASPETAEASPEVSSGEVTDGALAFTVEEVVVRSAVESPDAPVERIPAGEFVVVYLTVTNISDAPATFFGTFQKLRADGAVYSIDDEATFYTGGTIAELAPGDDAEVGVAFDVPPGSTPDSIALRGDPLSPGIDMPLS